MPTSFPNGDGDGGKAPAAKKSLWRKIACGVAPVLCTGLLLIMVIIVVFLTLVKVADEEVPDNVPYWLELISVPDWLESSKESMIDVEKENLVKIASFRAQYVAEIYGRMEENVLKLQAMAEQVLPELISEDVVVEGYVERNPGLEQDFESWDHSIWYITGYGVGEEPAWNNTLTNLLERCSLLEPTFRGLWRQHENAYVAALENPSIEPGTVSEINVQTYPAFSMEQAGYLTFTKQNGCDERFVEYGSEYAPNDYEPRCRVWYQDAVEDGNTGVVFTSPYTDPASGRLAMTTAAPVFDVDGSSLLGVAAIDLDYTDVDLRVGGYGVIGDEGYTYLIAPGSDGEVLVHKNSSSYGTWYIEDIEDGVSRAELGALVTRMNDEDSGNDSYSKNGKTWMISWKHMDTRIPSATTGESVNNPDQGFIAATTVSEAAALENYSNMEKDIRNHVLAAIIFISALIIATGIIIVFLARSLASSIKQPLGKLVDVVRALGRKDSPHTNQTLWLTDGLASPELKELVRSFEDMTTVIKFYGTSLRTGDLEAAQKNYMDALVLFEKIGNYRGVSIIYNNLGNVYTLQAKDLVEKAAATKNKVHAGKLLEQADANFKEAITSFLIAIQDAEELFPRKEYRRGRLSTESSIASVATAKSMVEVRGKAKANAKAKAEAIDRDKPEEDSKSDSEDDEEGGEARSEGSTLSTKRWSFKKKLSGSVPSPRKADENSRRSSKKPIDDDAAAAEISNNSSSKKGDAERKGDANKIAPKSGGKGKEKEREKDKKTKSAKKGSPSKDYDDLEAQKEENDDWPPSKSGEAAADTPKNSKFSSWFCWRKSKERDDDDGHNSPLTLALQLFNRKFNLALCLAAKGTSAVASGGLADLETIDEARKLLWYCADLAADMKDAQGDQRHVECLLELATLECDLPGREKQAGEALDAAEKAIIAYRGAERSRDAARARALRSRSSIDGKTRDQKENRNRVKGGIREESLEGTGLSAPLNVLRQQLLTARGAHSLTTGDPDAAIAQWTDAILDCGDQMDVSAVLSSLRGLRELAVEGLGGRFPQRMLAALGLAKGTRVRGSKNQKLIVALDVAIARVDSKAAKYTRVSEGVLGAKTTDVDICFVMNCTQSMQTWIDQFNKKLLPTVEQAKKEVLNINLRVAFVGYRDYGDKMQYEGPFNFQSEEELPKLAQKLKDIKADGGGSDIPDDMAGGLNLTLDLSWKSPIRIMMVITDSPCHGSIYHDYWDNYAKGCPKKLDPSKLLYTLQYQLGVDVYFVRISTQTDKMINILESALAMYTENRKNVKLPALRGSVNTEPKLLVHDLGVNKLRFSEAVVQSIRISSGISNELGAYY